MGEARLLTLRMDHEAGCQTLRAGAHLPVHTRISERFAETERHLRQASPEEREACLRQALDELREAVEQLEVTEHELRQQNEELATIRIRLEAERQRSRELFELAPDAYLVTDMEGVVRDANAAALQLFARSHERLCDKPLTVLFISARDFHRLVTDVNQAGLIRDVTFSAAFRDGRMRDLAVSALMAPSVDGGTHIRWIFRDVTERVRQERELRDLNGTLEQRVRERTRELERALHAQDEFLGMMSHELKTPITTIFGNAQLLKRRRSNLTEEALASSLDDIESESSRLQRLIDDLLTISRLETSRQETRLEPLLPRHIVQGVVASFQETHPNRRVELELPPTSIPVVAERTFLEQILNNLLTNAAKYSPPDAPIRLVVRPEDEQVVFSVLDRGKGIAFDELAKIFDPFYRSEGTQHDAPGVGVGLTVCKRLVEAQGGMIWASPREGGGTEFSFSLPIEPEIPEEAT